jgi:tetratricopeptide (TPR) repeat protein
VSSLLDVLHGRASRAKQTAETEQPLTDRQAAELLLPPELELAEGSASAHSHEPDELGVAELLDGDATATADVPPQRESTPPVGTRLSEDLSRSQGFELGHRRKPRRKALWLVPVAAGVAFAAFLALRFAGQDDDSFLATPGDTAFEPTSVAEAVAVAPPVPALQPLVLDADGAMLSRGAEPAELDAADDVAAAVDQNRSEAVALRSAAGGAAPAVERVRGGTNTDVAASEAGGGRATDELRVTSADSAEAKPSIQITRGSTEDPLFATLRDAYAALQAGDDRRAESLYREAFAVDPTSVDALLGLASLAVRSGRIAEGLALFRQVQRLDPRNATATASLTLLAGAAGQTSNESQLKLLLREQPASASLHFALGLLYVADQRWPDAQTAFFEAVRNDPTNADYAFNLAVSLDRLGQGPQAASYYQRALDLATGGQRFDSEAARRRLAELRLPRA